MSACSCTVEEMQAALNKSTGLQTVLKDSIMDPVLSNRQSMHRIFIEQLKADRCHKAAEKKIS